MEDYGRCKELEEYYGRLDLKFPDKKYDVVSELWGKLVEGNVGMEEKIRAHSELCNLLCG